MDAFDVRIHAIRRRPDRRRPFEVRWHAAGRSRSRSFITRGLADSYRAELIRAARKGLDFSPGSVEPASWDTGAPATISWLEHAAAYAAMKWPLAAACTRAGITDALATITPALFTPGRGRPPAAVLRTALYGHDFNPARAGTDPGPAVTAALAWARHHCLPLAALADPQVTRRALDALALRLDGTRAAAATIPWTASHGSPRDHPARQARSQLPPAEVQALLAEITRIRPELTAFFGCLYAALRPAEAVALRASSCTLPAHGWGQLTLTAPLPRSARAWTGNGTPRELRGLKHRPEGAIRTVPIPPQLARLLRWHLRAFGCTEDGRLFRGARGGPLSESMYGRTWHQARTAALCRASPGTQLMRRPYDLRHAALSLWLASGPRPPKSRPAPGTASGSCSPPTRTAYRATTRSPAWQGPPAPAAQRRYQATMWLRREPAPSGRGGGRGRLRPAGAPRLRGVRRARRPSCRTPLAGRGCGREWPQPAQTRLPRRRWHRVGRRRCSPARCCRIDNCPGSPSRPAGRERPHAGRAGRRRRSARSPPSGHIA